MVFTTRNGTLAALRKAGELCRDLRGSIRLIVPQEVHYAYPIDRPPVDVGFMRDKMADLALQGAGDEMSAVEICFCRDKLKALLAILKPDSLVLMGIRGRWWSNDEGRVAKTLGSYGHQVLAIRWK